MTRRRIPGIRRVAIAGLVSMLGTGTGCSLQEALIDGLFGGISDTVAAIVSDAALSAASQASTGG